MMLKKRFAVIICCLFSSLFLVAACGETEDGISPDGDTDGNTENGGEYEAETDGDVDDDAVDTDIYVNTYRWQGLSDIYCKSRVEADQEEDGLVEMLDCYWTFYDENDNIVSLLVDSICNGVNDYCYHYYYDENGRRISSKTSYDCLGEPDECRNSAYNSMGVLIMDGVDKGCDGTREEECTDVEFRPDGVTADLRYDYDCNGVFDYFNDKCEELTYDSEGHLLSGILDANCDGEINWCYFYVYDENWNMTEYNQDSDCDGTAGGCYHYKYSEENIKIEEAYLNYCDENNVNGCTTWTLDEKGRVIGRQTSGECGDYPYGYCTIWTYDGDDNLTSCDIDTDCNDYINFADEYQGHCPWRD